MALFIPRCPAPMHFIYHPCILSIIHAFYLSSIVAHVGYPPPESICFSASCSGLLTRFTRRKPTVPFRCAA
ncbi:hypothetical protein M407DRAFT_193999 [Tulasnella calospora MUT 4182]|uniref:Uncharacterized protein n=1 Tax=Tulasnella calospora MUT 4182 TaxID=1051891 RepID=A0A0C3L313_9AGAM|nr:hypothetical protein M407DRAFT_193999 [Tulasnella calospora MUT 4182]